LRIATLEKELQELENRFNFRPKLMISILLFIGGIVPTLISSVTFYFSSIREEQMQKRREAQADPKHKTENRTLKTGH
jgi:hypothetical protein